MRLKSLEIKGFKSFADKTQILLDHPITGVVGPNGCGKSNIVDAIRWVIGEHKIKSLRSDNLEDLIFNGSKTRNASGMAEVSLTFDNTRNLLPTEFTTVTITRKFYKNGESEYRLNDVTCRLKDIHNLFLDTGVSNDSYAIIELGMVDDIIKDKDNARRRMLEQAAGISIYKTRKKEAKLKLDATELDLARIEDLLFEIGNNLRTLESQARKAERYFAIKQDYKVISVELAKASLAHFNEEYRNLNQQHDAETDRRTQLDAVVNKAQAEIEKEKVGLIDKERALSALQKEFNELINNLRQLESDKKLGNQKIEHLSDREKTLNQFLTHADQQIVELQTTLAQTQENMAGAQNEIAQQIDFVETQQQALEEKRTLFNEKKQALETRRQAVQQLQRRQFEAEKEVAIADTSTQNMQRTKLQAEEEIKQRNLQLETLQAEKAQTEKQLQEKRDALVDIQKQQEVVKEKILSSQAALENQRTELVAENRKLDAKRNEHALLKSLVDSLEGYPDSIKYLKKNKQWSPDALLLSDVFVVEDGYRKALENVLDNYLNYYIANNRSEALQAIALLHDNKKGKANFFLLDELSPVMAQSAAAPVGLRPALDVVTVDDQYQALALHLLSSIFVAEEEAIAEQYQAQHGEIVVSKSGRVLNKPYSLGGGSTGVFEGNKLGRAKNLERLETEIKQLTATTQRFQQNILSTQSLLSGFNQELNDRAIVQCTQEIQNLNNRAINLSDRMANYEQLNQSSATRIAQLQTQIQDTEGKVSGSKTLLTGIMEEFSQAQKAIQTAADSFNTVEKEFAQLVQQYNDQKLKLAHQQSRWDGLQQELHFRENRIQELQQQITNNRQQLSAAQTEKQLSQNHLTENENKLYQLLLQKEENENTLNQQDIEYHKERNQLSEKESQLNQKRREKEHAETLLNTIKDKLNNMKLQLAGMKERLKVEFKVNLDDVLDEERSSDQSVEELTAEAEKLRKRLDNIGEVNPTAVETFTEMKARYDFIVEQKTDLTDARQSLMDTIQEVEQTANTKFKETFDSVRENFVQVFKALFTEDDNADLRLTQADNIADSNIEIYAQPKGKKPSTLTQLSGGEKTLTSTAFLFAIYLIKPAPFCILDEVDAPLDDANVGKFTQMIRKFSDNSQFIIVTHNKQTMAAVDVIYGVTMQEPGVSKLVPVDFRSLN